MSGSVPTTALRVAAHALALVGLLADAAQTVLNPPTLADVLPWGLAQLVLPVVALIVGWILAVRRPRLSLGWLLIAIGVLVSTEGTIGAIGLRLVDSVPTSAQWAAGQGLLWYGGADQWAWIPPVGLLFTQVPLRFPDGRLPSPRWRWFSVFTVVAIALSCAVFATSEQFVAPHVPNPTAGLLGAAEGPSTIVSAVLFASAFGGSIASLAMRYRRSTATTRAQLRWIFWAAAVVAGLLVLSWFGDPSDPGVIGPLDLIVASAAALAYSLIPLAILFAVLRYGLYSIDRIISRTVAYAILTVVVISTYGLVVLLISLLLPGLEHAPIGVALATLAAAAVFLPALRWVRRLIDRVFNRSQYDAERVVIAFGERIRNGADPHTAGADLVDAVGRTLQPVAVGLWVQETPR